MFFGTDTNTVGSLLKFKQNDYTVINELRPDWPANKIRKLMLTNGKILLYLDNAQFVCPAFGLYGNHIMHSLFVQPDVNFIRFNLSHVWNSGAQMVLK